MEGAKEGFARGRVWPRRILDARRASSLSGLEKARVVRDSLHEANRRSRKHRFSRHDVDEAIHQQRAQTVCYFRKKVARARWRLAASGAAAALVRRCRPRTRLSRRGLRAFTERDGQESQRKTPPGCVSPPFVAEPRPRPDAPAPFPRPTARARRRARSEEKAPTTRSSSRAFCGPATPCRGGNVSIIPFRSLALRASPRPPRPNATPIASSTAALRAVSDPPQTSSTTWRRSRATARARRSSSCS